MSENSPATHDTPADTLTGNLIENPLENSNMGNDDGTNDGVVMRLDYAQPSQVINSQVISQAENKTDSQQAHAEHVSLFSQLNRPDVIFHGKVKQPLLFRDALRALFDIVNSDYRYKPKDRTAYSAFLQMRKASPNDNLFASQQAYFDWLFNNDPLAYCILDPIVQVHEQGVTFEVFSKDEGCYAQLTFDNSLFELQTPAKFGTTFIDYTPTLLKGVEQIRSYRDTHLDIGHEAVELATRKTQPIDSQTADKPAVIEKRINVPKTWIRSLLQVQSASQITLQSSKQQSHNEANNRFYLDPVALYNLLFELRMHADIKGKKRGLLVELIPQQAPVMILEPFGTTIKSQLTGRHAVYQGQSSQLVRLWGRRRLGLLKQVLPYTQTVQVTLLGQGMPSYWTLSGEGFHLTFAMTGFSQANWSQALNFDLLLPKRAENDNLTENLTDLITSLQQKPQTFAQLLQSPFLAQPKAKTTKKSADLSQDLSRLLLEAGQQGLVRYDLATATYFYRPLTDVPLAMADFAYHNLAEKQAYDIVSRKDAIKNLVVNRLPTQGVQITADIFVAEDRRSYHVQIQMNEEGMVTRAESDSPQFLQHRLTQGVPSEIIALRLAYADYDSSRDPLNRWQQTRLFSKRLPAKKGNATQQNMALIEQIQLTQQDKKLILERHFLDSKLTEKTTRQQWLFNQPEHAHTALLQHIEQLTAVGFIENQVI